MVQGRNRQGFPFEPSNPANVLENLTRKDLEGDLPLKLLILGQINLAHASGPDAFDDTVMRNDLSILELPRDLLAR
jgi:hypothetical protein